MIAINELNLDDCGKAFLARLTKKNKGKISTRIERAGWPRSSLEPKGRGLESGMRTNQSFRSSPMQLCHQAPVGTWGLLCCSLAGQPWLTFAFDLGV